MGTAVGPDGLRSLPSVDRVLRTPQLQDLVRGYAREPVVRLVRRTLADIRSEMSEGAAAPDLAAIANRVASHVTARWTNAPVRVINASGVIPHTNLGRAPLAEAAISAMAAAAGYADLEIDLESGERDLRQTRVATMLRDLTGADAALMTTSNAAAVTLVLGALARGRDVIVSRGQLVEIGGGFRVPSIMRQSGARLVEVGTTNRTRLADYADAITPRTAAVLHVHSSNFKIVGFAEEVPLQEMATLVRARGVRLISDNGSGALIDSARFGLAHEPTPTEALEAGADVVCFSGDKLLGGPQAGIVLGSADVLDRISRHPLARAMRPDKLALAAMSATLLCYLEGRPLDLPVWRMIAATPTEIEARAIRWSDQARERGLFVELESGESTVGGGSLPAEVLPTTVVVLPRSTRAVALRRTTPPVIARTHRGRVLLDLRTVDAADESALLENVVRASSLD